MRQYRIKEEVLGNGAKIYYPQYTDNTDPEKWTFFRDFGTNLICKRDDFNEAQDVIVEDMKQEGFKVVATNYYPITYKNI